MTEATVVCNGLTVRIVVKHDGSGDAYVQLEGVDCNLEGEQPGMYYPTPLERKVEA